MAFRLIPAGSFRMGSRGYSPREEPIHWVTIPEPFWMAETPVTQAQFALWTSSERINHTNHFAGHPIHPAENMDWRQAVTFCAWLTRLKAGELPPGFALACLPTEAEWEYACRAGTTTLWSFGSDVGQLANYAWYDTGSPAISFPQKVGGKRPNPWGLYDVHGNVREWVQDFYDEGYYTRFIDLDPKGPDTGTERVVRSGYWRDEARYVRSANRFHQVPDERNSLIGFRLFRKGT